jgi:DNA mismatch repair protein MutS2
MGTDPRTAQVTPSLARECSHVQESVQQQSRRVLELPQVLDMVARHAWWEGSRQRVLALQPLPTLEDVRARQAEVAEAMTLEERMQTPPTRGMRDVDAEAEGAARGESLDPSRLLDVAQSLQVAVKVRRFFAERGDELPHMTRLAMQLVPLGALIERIHLAIMTESAAGAGRESQVKDTASHKLGDLRVQMRTVQNRIDSRMQGILKNASYHKMFQEPYVTTRNERYVVPIKSEYRGQFPGLVLDASASGATVFMEPLAILDLGNELRRLRAAETHEIERILHELSAAVGAVRDDVVANGELLARLDGLMAIARFGTSVRGRLVEVDQRQRMVLRGARHPLLGERAVPIDVELGEGIGILIITGPNTGGKTVTLKTMGLFTLMAMCGLPLPVADGSRLGFFDGVYADIGDEQDIQQNLSTFSSHMLQVSRILDAVGERSLVLLDEAGASTDPREGTALAISILEHLHQRGALVVTTTHYSELKAFAASYEGAANAAMEFDPETLQPTYRARLTSRSAWAFPCRC